MNNGHVPDFFVAGAPRCGTTTLYFALQAHPDIFMAPVKEPHYFAMLDIKPAQFRETIKKDLARFDFKAYLASGTGHFIHRWYVDDWEEYKALFGRAGNARRKGEASTSYLWARQAPGRIKEEIPDARVIISLRHPVERAFSHYLMERRMQLTKSDFHSHLQWDCRQPGTSWGAAPLYVETGLYFEAVKRFISIFGKERILVCLLEDLQVRYPSMMKSLFEFLEVDATFRPAMKERHNQAMTARNKWLERLAARAGSRETSSGPFIQRFRQALKKVVYTTSVTDSMTETDRQWLLSRFRDDTLRLQDLIGRDLSAWLA